MWSGITTYRSILTPGMFSLDNKYFSVILPNSVNCICGVNGSSKAPTPTGLIISESILFRTDYSTKLLKKQPIRLGNFSNRQLLCRCFTRQPICFCSHFHFRCFYLPQFYRRNNKPQKIHAYDLQRIIKAKVREKRPKPNTQTVIQKSCNKHKYQEKYSRTHFIFAD